MNIQYASDLHLEFEVNNTFMTLHPFISKASILVLSGDITYLEESRLENPFFEKIADQFEHTYIIPGNHEFYMKSFDIQKVVPTFEKKIKENITYLNNQTIYRDGLRILFTTLWTSISPERSLFVERMMNDFRQCEYSGDRFKVKQHNRCHQFSTLFLNRELAKPFNGKTIVVSHYVPFKSERCKYNFETSLNDVFHVNLERMFYDFKIDYWIHGHNHWNMAPFRINNTLICTNQLGYLSRDEHRDFKRDAVIEL